MSRTQFTQRRSMLLGLAVVGLVPLAGCMTKPIQPVNADGTYCHRIGKSFKPTLTCTTAAVPAAAVEAEAKRLEGTQGLLTVYVIRHSWSDALAVMPLTVDGTTGASTIPDSLVRLRLTPGRHSLSAKWADLRADIDVAGQGGDVQLLELRGSALPWRKSLGWQVLLPNVASEHVQALKLVADVQTRR